MRFRLRFDDGVDARLKPEIVALGKWIRQRYQFPNPLEIRLISKKVLTEPDGSKCALRWWQSSRGLEAVTGEIAVGSFSAKMRDDGPTVAFPTVVAAVGRVMKYYYQAIRNAPQREDHATRWGDRLLDAYVDGTALPPPGKRTRAE